MKKEKIDARLGTRLRRLRRRKDLTQHQLAEMAGISPNYVGAVERAEESPSLKVLYALASALDVEPRDLFEFDDDAASSPTKLRKEADRLLKQINDVGLLKQAVRLLRTLLA